MKKENKKCIVMLSGGLDSRLAIKIMQEQGFEVLALFYKLPVGTGCCDENCSFNFAQKEGVRLKVIDYSKGEALKEYLEILKKPKYMRGAGVNPCIDCRIFMFKKAKEFADNECIDLIVTGEVLGERPMSQKKNAMDIIEKESGLKGRILRPLCAKLLSETDAEKKGIVNREKLYDIQGRRREKQIALAKKFNISYPQPAGGCMLCEKELIKRFNFLFKRGLDEKEINLMGIGRHFVIDGCWVVIGRDKEENQVIEFVGKDHGKLIVPEFMGPSAIILDRCSKEVELTPSGVPPVLTEGKVNKLIKAYSKKGSLEERKRFGEFKL